MTLLLLTLLALCLWVPGYFHTGRFVRPRWKISGKFIFYMSISFALAYWFGYYSLIFILGQPLLGLVFHIKVCKKHQINWLTCEPKEKYLALQEKWAKGDFTK